MSERNEAIFRRWVREVWSEGNEATIDELFDKNAVATYPIGLANKPLYGIDEYKQFVKFVRRNFTMIDVTIHQIVADENKVVSYCTVRGEQRTGGDAQGSASTAVSASGLCQIILENERITQTWSNIDVGNLRKPFESN